MKSLERVNFKLYPTEEQKEIMLLNCHNARFAYNWAVARIKECLDNKQLIPSKYTLASEFSKFKKVNLFQDKQIVSLYQDATLSSDEKYNYLKTSGVDQIY